MNQSHQSTERIVVFVTPAQKRVLAARAASVGISLSELVRRAVLAFDDTGEEVRAAGLVDRLSAAPSRAADSDALRRLAAGQTGEAPGSPAAARGQRPARKADARHPAAGGTPSPRAADTQGALPVAAAVAQALAARAAQRADARSEADDEARVARILASESPPAKPEV